MDILRKHEIFEIEVLEKLKNGDFLRPLIFIGGTMLRLCYELSRYSTDLDFWFVKKTDQKGYFNKLKSYLSGFYEVTDAQLKFNSLLLELRSKNYPKRLKIEIRKELRECDIQERIAFSKYSTNQVVLRVIVLEEAMKYKIMAALDRKDIRDFFDLEFLLRQGVELKAKSSDLEALRDIAEGFKDKDYKVVLGSLLEADLRNYYVKNKFEFLIAKIDNLGKKI
ncbi:MAG: nucleotidyl transferase AbiEii/AbiGii toxin family protein [Candidatus Omnitrophica bacterium]|nr:nucleotidyl transferase AbiEii/AbiGii toxin family protein [Candidatus Omnitrophota bacterium]